MSKYYRVNNTSVIGTMASTPFETCASAVKHARSLLKNEFVSPDTVEVLEYTVNRISFRTVKKKNIK
jgi:hypothetical protein